MNSVIAVNSNDIGISFQIADAKLYVSAVILRKGGTNDLTSQSKSEFQR